MSELVSDTLPVVRTIPNARQQIRAANKRLGLRIVVLDDDPTGCQTVHDVPVLLSWETEPLRTAIERDQCLYILHNSRSVSGNEAAQLNRAIVKQLRPLVSADALRVISRSDSTLRGHFRAEVATLEQELGLDYGRPFDGMLVVPYFGEGGRLTIDDTHFVAEGTQLIPAHETDFAKDPVFGFTTAYLPNWIASQWPERWSADQVRSISLDAIRTGGVDAVLAVLLSVTDFTPVVVNATADEDLEIVVLALLEAERRGKRFLYRTAASFVKIRAGITDQPLYQPTADERGAGLLVVGSHVPKSTRQVALLQEQVALPTLELSVDQILGPDEVTYRQKVVTQLTDWLAAGQTPLLMTERQHRRSQTDAQQLQDGQRISEFLADVVRSLTVRPRFVVAKGGITAHDIACRGLGIYTARVLGQLQPGVPVWRAGADSHFPGLLYVVFPGNVGDDDSLAHIAQQLMNQ